MKQYIYINGSLSIFHQNLVRNFDLLDLNMKPQGLNHCLFNLLILQKTLTVESRPTSC
jgi:hypothetical protein